MKNVEFEGQTKTKLGNPEVRPAVDGLVVDELGALSKNKKNADVFDAMIKKAQGAAKTRNAARHAKEIARGKKEADSTKLIGKLANCSSRKVKTPPSRHRWTGYWPPRKPTRRPPTRPTP